LPKHQVDEKANLGCFGLLIFTDASRGEEVIGIGYIIRINGEKYTNSTYIEGNYTSMEAEYIALKTAVEDSKFIRETDRRVDLYSDCDPLVRKMNKKNGSEKWNKRHDEFQEVASDYNWNLHWVPRTNNRDADELASLGLRRGRDALD